MLEEKFQLDGQENQAVVRATGSLGEDGARQIRNIIQSHLSKGDRQLVVDMENVPYINSDGLRMLQDVLQQAETVDASVSLANVNNRVLRTLALTRMDTRLPIYESVEEALRSS